MTIGTSHINVQAHNAGTGVRVCPNVGVCAGSGTLGCGCVLMLIYIPTEKLLI